MLLLWGNRFRSEPVFQTWRWDAQTAERRRKLYLAGPMTGLPSLNRADFIDAAVRLRFLGFDVISPVELNPPSRDWAAAMKVAIPALMRCDAVALLPGWENSRGAALEVQIARQCEMELIPLVAEEVVRGKPVHKISPARTATSIERLSLAEVVEECARIAEKQAGQGRTIGDTKAIARQIRERFGAVEVAAA
jgi:hypothetical protein